MGTWASLTVALTLPTNVIPAWIVWILAFLAGMLAGALWGAIPGLLKATRNINEVLACIMTNWIAANLVTMLFSNSDLRNAEVGGKIGYIKPTIDNGVATAKLGLDKLTDNSQINAGILVAIGMAILIYILMNKTTLGYELKACGSNRHAARYAGINDKRNIVLSMAIAGALSGGGAALYWLSGNTEFYWSTYQALPAEGFNGIPVALLAANSPLGVVFSSIFMSLLNINGLQLKTLTAYNEFITDIIIAAIVYLSSFSLIIKMWLSQKKKKEAVQTPAPKADDAGKEE
jgi:simple sugar transport system permease protein